MPTLLVEMLLLAALKQYPLFDLRTSHFLTTAFAVTAAVGVAGLCSLLARIHLSIAFLASAVITAVFIDVVVPADSTSHGLHGFGGDLSTKLDDDVG